MAMLTQFPNEDCGVLLDLALERTSEISVRMVSLLIQLNLFSENDNIMKLT